MEVVSGAIKILYILILGSPWFPGDFIKFVSFVAENVVIA